MLNTASHSTTVPRHPLSPCLLPPRTRSLCRAHATVRAQPLAPKQSVVQASIEKTTWNSRAIFACVDIQAPTTTVWGCLTDYERLGTFIPSLVENKCLERRTDGCILYQVGAADVAMGVKFSAKCTLEITEHKQGVPADICIPDYHKVKAALPRPATSLNAPAQDIAFTLLEGDFEEYKGVWRVQQGLDGSHTTLLSYALYVLPQKWLPVGIIQSRITQDLSKNLEAVKKHAEKLHGTGKAASRAARS